MARAAPTWVRCSCTARSYRAERVILIYPWHEAIGVEGAHRRWTVTGGGYGFEVATVNVGRPGEVQQSLRRLLS